MRNIWIDTDPGIDDAIAIAAAYTFSDRLRICGISTVAGNQTIEIVTRNALWLTRLVGEKGTPVVRGAERPLIREAKPAGHVHGEHGLGYIIPDCEHLEAVSDQGAPFIYRVISSLPGEEKMTIVSIGPLTNIALLVRAFPDVKRKIDQIVCMGGSTVEGNITATAEYNIWADPEAAQIVFQSGIPIVMCGLDVTMKCLLKKEDIEKLEQEGGICREFSRMLKFYFDSPAYRGTGTVAMHDSVPFLYLLREEIFSGEHHVMSVSCTEDTCRGMTMICDGAYTYSQKNERKNVYVLKDVDGVSFRKELMNALLKYGNNHKEADV